MVYSNIIESKKRKYRRNIMGDEITIACVGDIMPGGILHNSKNVFDYVSLNVLNNLNEADLRIATLECAIGNNPDFDPEKMKRKQDVIYAPDCDIIKLKELGINCVSLANNHIYDLGEKGLQNTIKLLDDLGIKHCGAGNNINEASRPCSFKINDKKIGFLAFCDYRDETTGYVPFATETSSGINPMYEKHVIDSIKHHKSNFDYLFVILHWGREHSFYPTIEMKKLGKICIDSGCDGVIGGHPHRIQPIIQYHNRPIFFSLGNFLFPDRFLKPPRPMYYPDDTEETSKYPITDGHPWVDEPTFKIWKPLGRIGTIGKIIIDLKNNNIFHSYTTVRLSKENYLTEGGLSNKIDIANLKIAHWTVKSPFYNTVLFTKKCFTAINWRIKALLK